MNYWWVNISSCTEDNKSILVIAKDERAAAQTALADFVEVFPAADFSNLQVHWVEQLEDEVPLDVLETIPLTRSLPN